MEIEPADDQNAPQAPEPVNANVPNNPARKVALQNPILVVLRFLSHVSTPPPSSFQAEVLQLERLCKRWYEKLVPEAMLAVNVDLLALIRTFLDDHAAVTTEDQRQRLLDEIQHEVKPWFLPAGRTYASIEKSVDVDRYMMVKRRLPAAWEVKKLPPRRYVKLVLRLSGNSTHPSRSCCSSVRFTLAFDDDPFAAHLRYYDIHAELEVAARRRTELLRRFDVFRVSVDSQAQVRHFN